MITVKSLVDAGLYPSEEAVLQEALGLLWRERPQLRLDWAVYQYRLGAISLARAAALAGVSFDYMKETLVQRGIQPRLGAEQIEEARSEFLVLKSG